jgi:hypothetical protein
MKRKYTGPARGIPTHREIISDKAEAVIFILLAVVAAVIIYLE